MRTRRVWQPRGVADALESGSPAELASGPGPRPRNDPGQYDDLATHWWDARGPFAMLHWLAAARGAQVPPPSPGTTPLLVDLGCGAGLLAPHVPGYRHVGVDLTASALVRAAEHGVAPVRGSVCAVPLRGGCADVVAAGEILEHVTDLDAAVAEACRLLRPGGLLVIDTLAATALGRFLAVTLAERLRGAPRGIHDPDLFVDRDRLRRACSRHGVDLALWGIRPSVRDLAGWIAGRRDTVRMVPAPTSAVLFQAVGRRAR